MRNPIRELIAGPVAVAALAIATAVTGPAAASGSQSTDQQSVETELQDAMSAIGEYGVEQRDAAVREAEELLVSLDAKIEHLQTRMAEEWATMSADARKKAETAMTELRRKRTDVAEWFGGLKHGSAEAWQEVRSGFTEAYDDARKAVTEAFEDAGQES